jgi:hypothetical protein
MKKIGFLFVALSMGIFAYGSGGGPLGLSNRDYSARLGINTMNAMKVGGALLGAWGLKGITTGLDLLKWKGGGNDFLVKTQSYSAMGEQDLLGIERFDVSYKDLVGSSDSCLLNILLRPFNSFFVDEKECEGLQKKIDVRNKSIKSSISQKNSERLLVNKTIFFVETMKIP